MAGLPEIELLKERLKRAMLHKRLGTLQVSNARGEHVADGAGMEDGALKGREITDVRRYGHYLFLELNRQDILVMNLGGELTGDLERGPTASEGEEGQRGALEIQVNGHNRLRLQGTQLHNRLRLLDENADVDFLTKLGPDPLLVHDGLGALRDALARRRSAVRNILLDDAFVPGIGSTWADEILFQARIRPDRTAPSLSEEERSRLLEQIPRVLERAVRCQAKPGLLPKTYLTRHHHDGHCPSCGGPLGTLAVGGKNALFCPVCQQ